MPKFRVQLKIEDNYTVEVKAKNSEAAGEKAIGILAKLKDPINTNYFNGSSGFDVWDTEELT